MARGPGTGEISTSYLNIYTIYLNIYTISKYLHHIYARDCGSLLRTVAAPAAAPRTAMVGYPGSGNSWVRSDICNIYIGIRLSVTSRLDVSV